VPAIPGIIEVRSPALSRSLLPLIPAAIQVVQGSVKNLGQLTFPPWADQPD